MLGLYIHIPFCRKKCRYCDFVSVPVVEDAVERYLGALRREMERYAGMRIDTLYVGGGTPTVASGGQLAALFGAVRSVFDCRHLSEITVEANPESATEDTLRALRALGANRLSLGAQSLKDDDLRFLGRVHTRADFERAYRSARRIGFTNITVDLIYGLPGQSLVQWKEMLRKAVVLDPEHLSLYPLTVEPGTDHHASRVAVDDELQAQMYEWSIDFLSQAGYEHYEISNWARPGFKCRHNVNYWHNGEYLGLGAAAASHVAGCRRKNMADIDRYIDAAGRGEPTVGETETIDDARRLSEDIILRLRCRSGFALSPRIDRKYGAEIDGLIRQNLLEKEGDTVRLTRRGLLLANQVMKEFV